MRSLTLWVKLAHASLAVQKRCDSFRVAAAHWNQLIRLIDTAVVHSTVHHAYEFWWISHASECIAFGGDTAPLIVSYWLNTRHIATVRTARQMNCAILQKRTSNEAMQRQNSISPEHNGSYLNRSGLKWCAFINGKVQSSQYGHGVCFVFRPCPTNKHLQLWKRADKQTKIDAQIHTHIHRHGKCGAH